MEHFKRLAFCMLYLFTFIWQLSAQVKKIRVSGFPWLASFLLSV